MTYRTEPTPQIAQSIPVPLPHKGMDAITALSEMEPDSAIYIYNMICTQAGLQVRPGYTEWAKNLTGTGGVRTVIPVRASGGATDKLFAVTANGIWDVTSQTSSPTQVVTFGTTSGNAGWGSWDHCTNAGGDQMVLYCDEINGYYTYDTATTTWTKVTAGAGANQINGVDPATFAFVRLFNNRVWFVQSGTGNSWYLPVGQIYGTATLFSFGNKFNHGGNLNSLWGFTYGSYFGTYVYLVGISDAGDVIAYTGSDPTQATTWSMSGQWYVGDLPPGRRCASNYGGDLTILSSYGAVNLSSLFYQKDLSDPNTYVTKKIAPAIKSEITLNQIRGWEIVPWAGGNSMLILDPNYNSQYQFCYCFATNGWSVFRNAPMQTATVWHTGLYAGTPDGRVVLYTGGQDNVTIGSSSGNAVQWGFLGAFNNLKMPGSLKFVDLIRPYFTTDQNVGFNVFVRFNFNISDLVLGSGVPSVNPLANAWDTGIWDSTVWGASSQNPQVQVVGQSGSGQWLAAGLLGASVGSTTAVALEASVRMTKSFL